MGLDGSDLIFVREAWHWWGFLLGLFGLSIIVLGG